MYAFVSTTPTRAQVGPSTRQPLTSNEQTETRKLSAKDWANEEQMDYMKYLATRLPEQLCYCGWYDAGTCPHCPADKTAADKLKDREPKRR